MAIFCSFPVSVRAAADVSTATQESNSMESACAMPYPKGAPVNNARNELLRRFLQSFEYWDNDNDGEVIFTRASKDEAQTKIFLKRSPKNLQKRLNFVDAAVLTAYPSFRVFDTINGELFPAGISLTDYRMKDMVYRSSEATELVRKAQKDQKLLLIRAIPSRVLDLYPGLYSKEEIDAPSNFRVYKGSVVNVKALSDLRRSWINLFLSSDKPDRKQIEELKIQVDRSSQLLQPL